MEDTIQKVHSDIEFEMELQRIAGERMPDATIIIDEDSNILYTNYQAQLMFEYTAEDFRALKLESLLVEKDRASHGGFVKGFFSDPRPRPMAMRGDLPAINKKGKQFLVNIFIDGAPTTRGNVGIAYIRKKLDKD